MIQLDEKISQIKIKGISFQQYIAGISDDTSVLLNISDVDLVIHLLKQLQDL